MRTWLKTLGTLVVVTAAGYVVDRVLHREGVTTVELLLLSDFLVGLVAAALVFILVLHHEQRTRYIAGRLAIIAEMNHHIRNALQVITFQMGSGKDEKEIEMMREAMNRITWALSEVLPKMPGEDHAHQSEAVDKAASEI